MRSIQSRLGTGLLVSLLLFFGLQWLAVVGSIRRLAEDSVASRLERDGEGLLAALTITDPSAPSLAPGPSASMYQQPFSGHYYQIAVGDVRLRSRSLWDQTLTLPAVGIGESKRLTLAGPARQPLLVVVTGYRKQDRPVTIAVAEDLTPIDAALRRVQWRYGAVSLAALIVLMLIQWRIMRGGLAPLDKARRELAALERGDATRLDEAAPAEVRPLIGEINRLLEAMTQRLQRSRHALGNLAHALKTPLTLLARLADRPELREHSDLNRQLIEQTRLLQSLIDRELKRARLAGAARPGQMVRLRDEAVPLLEALAKIHHDKTVAVECAIAPGLTVAIDREDLLELLGNLLDNAFKWARGRVRLGAEANGAVVLAVEDDGPGCPPEELARLTQRGVRIDEAAAGHGIGLAIVREMVEQYGGTLVFGRSERLGGFSARVSLPVRR
ncbi:MAG: HAMP domain-containing sensor histidine kinase [Nitrospirota bacterium]